ncbi:MAG: CRISPR-associated endoribonuclease Cas6 [Methanobacteriaceae archaeon]|nr:CRISPR-associated endoribonuclease Cas6 [Methanobacteriaceae archaeon]
MRLKITLKSKTNYLKIPFNYNHWLSAIIYKKIDDLNLSQKLHSSTSFKFFTFSQINVPFKKITKTGIISKNGVINFYISSSNDYLIKSMVNGYLNDLKINFGNHILFVEKIELIPEIKINNKMKFNTISPIIVRTKKEINGKLKIWDLSPSPDFFKGLEKNLVKKFNSFNNSNITDKIFISSDMRNVKRKRIGIKKDNNYIYQRAYMMDLILEGDPKLIKFAYDAGIGEKNSMGFGMLDVFN